MLMIFMWQVAALSSFPKPQSTKLNTLGAPVFFLELLVTNCDSNVLTGIKLILVC